MPIDNVIIRPVPRHKRDNFNNIRAFVQFVLVGDFGSFAVRGARIFVDPRGKRRVYFPDNPARIICPSCRQKMPHRYQYCGNCATCIAGKREGEPDLKAESLIHPIDSQTRSFIENLVISVYDSLYDDDGNEIKSKS